MTLHRETDPLTSRIDLALMDRDFQGLERLHWEDRRVWRTLQFNLYQADETLRWHSIEAIGALARADWELGRRERVRDYLRRLVWSISDESGGIGWNAPQTIAETVTAIPELHDPFVNIMVDRAFSEPTLVKSGLWGIGRLGRSAAPSIEFFRDNVLAAFEADDAETLGLAAWAVGQAGYHPARPYLEALKPRREPVRIYVPPRFNERPLGDWAGGAAAILDS